MKTDITILRIIWLSLYYGFARHLPVSYRVQPFGKIFMRIRQLACKGIFKSMGKNVNVQRGASFGSGAMIEIGDNSLIGTNCQMPNNVKIGNDVMIGPDVLFIGYNHNFENLEIPMRLQGFNGETPISVSDDVWIGARSIILPSVTIGKGSIVGAGSVVTKDVPPYSICAGNPARVIKSRLPSPEE